MAAAALALLLLLSSVNSVSVAGTWCVVRSEASDQALQAALDYACAAGADCAPLRSTGLCFLPNTVQAHASYAFNSYYQRRRHAAGTCSFGGTATIATTDPSYGSCVYPWSPSTAGGIVTSDGGTPTGSTSSGAMPTIIEPPPLPPATTVSFNGSGGIPYLGMGPAVMISPSASPDGGMNETCSIHIACWLILLVLIFQTM